MIKTMNVEKWYEEYTTWDDAETDLIRFDYSDAERANYEIVDDYLDAQEWVDTYEIKEQSNDVFMVKINNETDFNYRITIETSLTPFEEFLQEYDNKKEEGMKKIREIIKTLDETKFGSDVYKENEAYKIAKKLKYMYDDMWWFTDVKTWAFDEMQHISWNNIRKMPKPTESELRWYEDQY